MSEKAIVEFEFPIEEDVNQGFGEFEIMALIHEYELVDPDRDELFHFRDRPENHKGYVDADHWIQVFRNLGEENELVDNNTIKKLLKVGELAKTNGTWLRFNFA